MTTEAFVINVPTSTFIHGNDDCGNGDGDDGDSDGDGGDGDGGGDGDDDGENERVIVKTITNCLTVDKKNC